MRHIRRPVGTTDGLSVYDADTGATVEIIEWILGFSGVAAADGRLYAYERGHNTVKALDTNTLDTLGRSPLLAVDTEQCPLGCFSVYQLQQRTQNPEALF